MFEQQKVHISQKDHAPECLPKFDRLKVSILSNVILPDNTILLDDNGRKRFDAKYSDTETFRSSCKLIPHREVCGDYEYGGKRYIAGHPKCLKEIENQKRRHLEADANRRSETSQLPSVNWTTKKIVVSEDGVPAYRKESKLFNLETFMNQKQRINSEYEKRNGIGTSTPGDKSYYTADREPGFYAAGGLVVGSTIAIKKSGKPTLKKNAESTSKSLGVKLGLTYEEKQKQLEFQHEINDVNYLTIGMIDSGEAIPSWEEKTGMYLVKPEDEKY